MQAPEIWGHCPNCEHWFYCEGWFDKNTTEPRCPVCETEPNEIENRAVRSPG